MQRSRAWISGLLGVALVAIAAACTWQGLRPGGTGLQRLYIVGTPPHVTDQEIITAITAQVEGGFFKLDLRALQKAVEALPWVAAAQLYRRWPNGLVVRVREHRAIALWGEDAVLAANGTVFRPAREALPEGLPTLVGPKRSREQMRETLPELRGALAPLEAGIARVHLSARGSWTVTLTDGLELRLGRSRIIKRASRFAVVGPPAIGEALATAEYVDLRYDSGFAVGGMEPVHDSRGKRG